MSQTYTGSISGKVTDPTGLAVPGVGVVVVEESTQTTVRSVTTESGDYTISFLKPGTYRAAFSAKGFKERVETGIPLQINQDRRLDPTLEVGQVTEMVEVVSSGQQVN